MADVVLKAESPAKNLPVLRIELRQKETKDLEGMKPGDPIVIMAQGTLRSVELREPYSESKDDFVGFIEVECSKVAAEPPDPVDDTANEFSEMAD